MMSAFCLVVFLWYSNCVFPALGWAWGSVNSLWNSKNENTEETIWTLSEDDKTSNDLLESIALYNSKDLFNFGDTKIEEELFLYDHQKRTPFDWALHTWKKLHRDNSYWLFEADNVIKKLLECGVNLDKYVAWQLIAEDEKRGRTVKKTYLEYIKEDSVLRKRIADWLKSLIKKNNLATLPEDKGKEIKQLKRIASWKCWHEALVDISEKRSKPDKDVEVWSIDSDGETGD